jgi:hypothetical protein
MSNELLSGTPFDRFTQCAVTRHNYWTKSTEDWLDVHSQAWSGADHDINATLGAWDFDDEIKAKDAPVFVPWYMIDIDEDEPKQSLYHARKIVSQILNRKLTPSVFYSGNRGFHIAVPSGNFNNVVFASIQAAKMVMRPLLKMLAEDSPYDEGLASPVHLLRVPGALRDNGRRKVPISTDELYSDVASRMIRGYDHETTVPFTDPRTVAVSNAGLTTMRSAVRAGLKEFKRIERLKNRRKQIQPGVIKPFVEKLLKSEVRRGQRISAGVTGRNKAAYVVACGLFESGLSFDDVLGRVLKWNENKVKPSMPHREVDMIVRSAHRTYETS